MGKYIAITVLDNPSGGFDIALITDKGEDNVVDTLTDNLATVEATARTLGEQHSVSFKKRYMIHQRVDRSLEDKQLYLTQCNKLGKQFYHEYTKTKGVSEFPPEFLNKPNTFDVNGWTNFKSGWNSEYVISNTEAVSDKTEETKSEKGGLLYDKNTHVAEIPTQIIASKLGVTAIEGRAIKFDPEVVARLSERGVLVDIHIGRWRAKKTISAETLGIESKDEKVQDFIKSHINLGEVRLIPKHMETELDLIENKARLLLDAYSIKTLWGRFLPANAFEEWYTKNLQIKAQFMELGAKLSKESPQILKQMLVDIEGLAQEVYTRESGIRTPPPVEWMEHYRQMIVGSFPTRKAILDSFQFNVTYAEVPVASFSKWKDAEHEESPVGKMKSIIASDEDAASQLDPLEFYKTLTIDLASDVKNKFEAIEASLQKTGRFVGRISMSTSQTISYFRIKRDPFDTLPELLELDSRINLVDSFMIQAPKLRDLSKLLIAVRNVRVAAQNVMDTVTLM